MNYIGEIAALSTAICWAITSVLFARAGTVIGSFNVNKIRLTFAVFIYAVVLLLSKGRLFPENLNTAQIGWLVLSGIVWHVIGDGCGFKALVMIGPRLTTIMCASAPIMTTLIAWFMLGEQLSFMIIIGIVVTMAGISWVVTERHKSTVNQTYVDPSHPDSGSLFKGSLLGLVAAFGMASGLIMAKQAMLLSGSKVPVMEASFIRMLAATIVIWVFSVISGQAVKTFQAIRQVKAFAETVSGAFLGPFLGVWMSLVAVSMIAAGVAATLNAMVPIMILPIVVIFNKEKVTLRSALGAVIAVAGVAILFIT